MIQNLKIKAPFFEIGPKNYLWGDDVVELAKVADEASKKYDVKTVSIQFYSREVQQWIIAAICVYVIN